jgi:hypothetical protein
MRRKRRRKQLWQNLETLTWQVGYISWSQSSQWVFRQQKLWFKTAQIGSSWRLTPAIPCAAKFGIFKYDFNHVIMSVSAAPGIACKNGDGHVNIAHHSGHQELGFKWECLLGMMKGLYLTRARDDGPNWPTLANIFFKGLAGLPDRARLVCLRGKWEIRGSIGTFFVVQPAHFLW